MARVPQPQAARALDRAELAVADADPRQSSLRANNTAIASLRDNIYVKIPVANTKGDFSGLPIATLSRARVKLNVTVVFTNGQVDKIAAALAEDMPALVSVFAGRLPIPAATQYHTCARRRRHSRMGRRPNCFGQAARASRHLQGRRNLDQLHILMRLPRRSPHDMLR